MQKIVLLLVLLPLSVQAVPIDWHGVFGVDSTLIDNFRRVESKVDNSGAAGSQEVALGSGAHANASFQSYLFRLNPTMIINDAATFKGELTSGYGRGGRLGEDSVRSLDDDMGNALYMNNSASGGNSLIINKLFVELYSDTATYVIGRHTAHWGLGAVVNSGDDTWDRHTFIRDGITLKFKIGNFKIEPYWSKVSSENSLTRATKVKEYGFSLLYDNNDSDLALGILFGKKSNSKFDTTITRDTTATALGETDVKLTDLYFRKGFGDLSLAIEVPILSGEIGYAFVSGTEAKYKAKAVIFKGSYQASDSWSFGIDAGSASGESGDTTSYDAMFLNPNYQIAKLLFRYNRRAISDTTKNVYDSYITNALFAKFGIDYSSESWLFKTAFIWAVAQETATAGSPAYNHTTNSTFNATTSQDDQLGYEIDVSLDYKWNNEITVGSSAAYLFTGDYWAYTDNSATVNAADNSFLLQVRTSIDF